MSVFNKNIFMTHKLSFYFISIFALFLLLSQYVYGEDSFYLRTLEEAIATYKQGDQNKAAKLLKECVIFDRNNYLAWYWGGFMSEPERAIKNFDQAIEFAPNEPDPYAMRGHLKLQKSESTLDNNYLEGIRDLSKALSLDFNNIPACYYKAGDLIRSDNIRDAIPYLQRIVDSKTIENQPLYKTYLVNYQENSHHSLSRIYYQLQMYDKALEHINIAIQGALLPSNNLQTENNLSDYYRLRYEINKYVNKENAIKDIDKIIELKSSFFNELICHKIDLLIDLNKRDDALHLVKEMLIKFSVDSSEYIWCVHCLGLKLEQTEDAIIAINKCNETNLRNRHSDNLISNSDLHTFYVTRALLNVEKEQLNSAYEDITKSIELIPKESQIYLLRAKILYKLNRTDEAQKDVELFLKTSSLKK
jgi:tetratricopeptide (TPR) repeat protein